MEGEYLQMILMKKRSKKNREKNKNTQKLNLTAPFKANLGRKKKASCYFHKMQNNTNIF